MYNNFIISGFYRGFPRSVPKLKEGIRTEINNIQPGVCERAVEYAKDLIIRCSAAICQILVFILKWHVVPNTKHADVLKFSAYETPLGFGTAFYRLKRLY